MEQSDTVIKTGIHKEPVKGKSIHIEIDPLNPYKSALEDFKDDVFDFIIAGDKKSENKTVKYIKDKEAFMTTLFSENSDVGEKLFQNYQRVLSRALDEKHIRKGRKHFNFGYACSRQHFLFMQTINSFDKNLDFAMENIKAPNVVNYVGARI